MSRWMRLWPICLAVFLGAGCAVTHPRRSPDLDKIVASPKRIAVLRPAIDAKVKYISVPEFFLSPSFSALWSSGLATGLRRNLERDGHFVYHSIEIQEMLPGGRQVVEEITDQLVALTEKAIVADPDYSRQNVPLAVNAKGLIPAQLQNSVDLIVATKGRATIETIREFYARWFRNIALNLATLPITASSAFIPVPLPISVTISTSFLEKSPEDCFISMIVIDTKSGRIVYQNDYFNQDLPNDATGLGELALDLLEEFVRGKGD